MGVLNMEKLFVVKEPSFKAQLESSPKPVGVKRYKITVAASMAA